MSSTKIFCVGLNKTGTISLHHALETLGFRSLHWGGPRYDALVNEAAAAGRPLVDDIPGYDAYSDIVALSKRYQLLDEQYPGSRFVLTTRPVEDWIESRRAHVQRNVERAAAGTYSGNFLTVDADAWRQEFEGHSQGVATYFQGRDNLLTMRITEGDGFEVLCPFLGLDVPEEPFPWRHRATWVPTAPPTTARRVRSRLRWR